jgi:hypothetical protein
MLNTLERQLREYGIDNIEQYFQQIGQTVDDYRDSIRPQAEIMAKRNLLISEIFRQEGITVSDAEIDERINRMLGIPASDASATEAATDPNAEAVTEDVTENVTESDAETATVEASTAEVEHDHDHDHDHDDDDDHDHDLELDGAANADTLHALRDMMMSGSGRAVLESQILQESSIARLLAIVRGQEVPPRPEPKAAANEEAAADAPTAEEGEAATSMQDETGKDETGKDETGKDKTA